MSILDEPIPAKPTFSDLRSSWLSLDGKDAAEVHGWLIGVACAMERQRGSDPREMDGLIAELRASFGYWVGDRCGVSCD